MEEEIMKVRSDIEEVVETLPIEEEEEAVEVMKEEEQLRNEEIASSEVEEETDNSQGRIFPPSPQQFLEHINLSWKHHLEKIKAKIDDLLDKIEAFENFFPTTTTEAPTTTGSITSRILSLSSLLMRNPWLETTRQRKNEKANAGQHIQFLKESRAH